MTTKIMTPDLLLEQYLLNELSPTETVTLRQRIASDTQLQARLIQLDAANQIDCKQYPAQAMIPLIRARAAKKELRRFSLPRLTPVRLLSPIALSILALVVILNRTPNQSTDFGETIRLKGGEAGLIIFRKNNQNIQLLPPHAAAYSGDSLQIYYQSFKNLFGVIFSVDGSGTLTLHFPEIENQNSPQLLTGIMQALPSAYRLDKAPLFERFYLVTSVTPFATAAILDKVRNRLIPGQPPPDSLLFLPSSYRQYSYTIQKPFLNRSKAKTKNRISP
jgi:hypothetical protein